ncbi:MAG TPA: Holliday junction resolvase RuvX [Bacteroidia bacterium]|nr:Holliday junction resolvase RuvX [Bacteroidia bacterium]
MPRILAIDYGQKRCGIAVTDTQQIIATGLTTVQTHELMKFLEDYFQKETVETVVVGEPKKMSGESTHATPLVAAFVKNFRKHFPHIPVTTIDERFTSKIAFRSMVDSGLKKKDRANKELIDEVSATILLQDYLSGSRS